MFIVPVSTPLPMGMGVHVEGGKLGACPSGYGLSIPGKRIRYWAPWAPFSVNDLSLSYFAGKKPSVMQMRVLPLLKNLN